MVSIASNSIKHQSFVYTQLNDQTILFQTIQFSIRYLFALSLNINQFYFIHRWNRVRCFPSGSEWQWTGTPHSPKVQNWSLTIRWFNVVSRTLVRGGSYSSAEIQSVYSSATPSRLSCFWVSKYFLSSAP